MTATNICYNFVGFRCSPPLAILFFSFKKTLLKLFISLGCKYNTLQFGIRISTIEASKHSLHRTMSTTNLTEGNPSRSNSFFKSKGIQSVLHKALGSVQPFTAEELPETAGKA